MGASGDGDYTAGGKVGRLADGRYIIADMKREQFETNLRDQLIKNTAVSDGRLLKQSLPQDPGQAGKSQVLAFAKLLAGHNVHFSPESGDSRPGQPHWPARSTLAMCCCSRVRGTLHSLTSVVSSRLGNMMIR